MKTKNLFTTICSMMLFTALTYAQGTVPIKHEETVVKQPASDFPVGAKVSVSAFQELNKSCPESLSDRPESVSGEVVESDLVKDENGNYSGCVIKWGTKHCFKGAHVINRA